MFEVEKINFVLKFFNFSKHDFAKLLNVTPAKLYYLNKLKKNKFEKFFDNNQKRIINKLYDIYLIFIQNNIIHKHYLIFEKIFHNQKYSIVECICKKLKYSTYLKYILNNYQKFIPLYSSYAQIESDLKFIMENLSLKLLPLCKILNTTHQNIHLWKSKLPKQDNKILKKILDLKNFTQFCIDNDLKNKLYLLKAPILNNKSILDRIESNQSYSMALNIIIDLNNKLNKLTDDKLTIHNYISVVSKFQFKYNFAKIVKRKIITNHFLNRINLLNELNIISNNLKNIPKSQIISLLLKHKYLKQFNVTLIKNFSFNGLLRLDMLKKIAIIFQQKQQPKYNLLFEKIFNKQYSIIDKIQLLDNSVYTDITKMQQQWDEFPLENNQICQILEQINFIKKNLNISIKELASILKICPATLYKWNENSLLTTQTFNKLTKLTSLIALINIFQKYDINRIKQRDFLIQKFSENKNIIELLQQENNILNLIDVEKFIKLKSKNI